MILVSWRLFQLKVSFIILNDGFYFSLKTNVFFIEEVQKTKLVKAIKSAKDDNIYVIADDFFDNINPTSSREEFVKLLDEKKISDWGSNVSLFFFSNHVS